MANSTIVPNDLGERFSPGDRAFSHYTMKAGVIGEPDEAGWFYFRQEDGTRDYLNGVRVCSLRHARRMGWYDGEL